MALMRLRKIETKKIMIAACIMIFIVFCGSLDLFFFPRSKMKDTDTYIMIEYSEG